MHMCWKKPDVNSYIQKCEQNSSNKFEINDGNFCAI
jgi:hypothetical protein